MQLLTVAREERYTRANQISFDSTATAMPRRANDEEKETPAKVLDFTRKASIPNRE
jgi:hypothetical protein